MALFLQEYVKLRLIGKGSFASVYKVRHADLGYVRAIKVSNEIIEDANDRAYQTFLNECRVLLKIGNGCHPNIVRVYQPRLIDNKAIVEMDYVDGDTLSNYLSTKKFVDMDEFWRFATEIVSAVAYCHADLYKFLMDPEVDDIPSDPTDGSKLLITPEKERELRAKYCVNHNDLHSNNIIRRHYDGSFVLLDFGLAIQNNHCVKSSSRGDGAYEYCSPEKLDGEAITAASDVYSLGVLLYEMLSGRVPFVMDLKNNGLEKARFDVYNKHHNAVPDAILPLRDEAFRATHPDETYHKDYPDRLEQIIFKCLAKKPEQRYADASELLKDLLKVKKSSASQQLSVDKTEMIALAPVSPPVGSELVTIIEQNKRLSSQVLDLESEKTSLANELKESRQSNKVLKQQVDDLTSRLNSMGNGQEMPYRAPVKAVQSKPGSTLMWILCVMLLMGSVGWTVYSYIKTDYFVHSDELRDQLTIGAGVISLICVAILGSLRRIGTWLWVISGMFITLTATMQYQASFDRVKILLTALTAVSLVFYMGMWITTARDMTTSAPKPGPRPPYAADNDIEVAKFADED